MFPTRNSPHFPCLTLPCPPGLVAGAGQWGQDNSGGRVMMGERNETCDLLVRSRMVKVGGAWQCTDCGKEATLNALYAHVETQHVNVSFECIICMKECKTRNSLLLHRSRYHKGF